METPNIMDITQASKYLQLNPKSLSDLAHRGLIPALKLKNKWRFSKDKLDAWLNEESEKNMQPKKDKPKAIISEYNFIQRAKAN